MNRIEREKRTITIMISMYCRKFHGVKRNICSECKELNDYAYYRLDRCFHSPLKPSCNKCKTQCWEPAYKDKIIKIMMFSGPRLLFTHPILAIKHIFDNINSK